jgi:serine phosphatase RsbU (regulator of sigma subunit)
VGKELGISQVQVSRIEKGEVRPAENIIAKIQKLIKKPLIEYSFKLTTDEDKNWKYAFHVYPEKYSGDSIVVDSKSLPDKSVIFHTDAVGSDVTAGSNALLIEICSQAAISNLEIGSSPEAAYYRLNKMYKNIRTSIRGEPSLSMIFANQFFDKIEFVNGGMPSMLLCKQKENKAQVLEEYRFPAVGLLPSKEYVSATSIKLEKSDVLFSFSDGFVEFFKMYSNLPLEIFLATIANAYKGDSESIGNRLIKHMSDISKNRTISDDLSFIIISKK